jgi:phospholipid transport system substrate-binding protein
MKIRINIVAVSMAILVAVFVLVPTSSSNAVAQPYEDAKDFVETVAGKVVANIKDPDLSKRQRLRRYGQIFDDALDSKLIARIAIGRHLRKASPEQKAQYFKDFRSYIIDIYANRFGGHGDAKLEFLSKTRATKKDALVSARIKGPKMSPKDVTFRVRNSVDKYKIVDVTVDGVSLVVTKRSEFNSIIYNQGIDGLLKALAEKRFDGPNPTLLFEVF